MHASDAADLHAGKPDRRAFREPGDLGEVGVDRVARLEEPRPRAESVHHTEEGDAAREQARPANQLKEQ